MLFDFTGLPKKKISMLFARLHCYHRTAKFFYFCFSLTTIETSWFRCCIYISCSVQVVWCSLSVFLFFLVMDYSLNWYQWFLIVNLWLQLELVLSSGTVCLALYSLIAGIFGMNIPYTWNADHGYMFKWVSTKF